jgi:hypothetical protein
MSGRSRGGADRTRAITVSELHYAFPSLFQLCEQHRLRPWTGLLLKNAVATSNPIVRKVAYRDIGQKRASGELFAPAQSIHPNPPYITLPLRSSMLPGFHILFLRFPGPPALIVTSASKNIRPSITNLPAPSRFRRTPSFHPGRNRAARQQAGKSNRAARKQAENRTEPRA